MVRGQQNACDPTKKGCCSKVDRNSEWPILCLHALPALVFGTLKLLVKFFMNYYIKLTRKMCQESET